MEKRGLVHRKSIGMHPSKERRICPGPKSLPRWDGREGGDRHVFEAGGASFELFRCAAEDLDPPYVKQAGDFAIFVINISTVTANRLKLCCTHFSNV